jgi:hypothetical protein
VSELQCLLLHNGGRERRVRVTAPHHTQGMKQQFLAQSMSWINSTIFPLQKCPCIHLFFYLPSAERPFPSAFETESHPHWFHKGEGTRCPPELWGLKLKERGLSHCATITSPAVRDQVLVSNPCSVSLCKSQSLYRPPQKGAYDSVALLRQ